MLSGFTISHSAPYRFTIRNSQTDLTFLEDRTGSLCIFVEQSVSDLHVTFASVLQCREKQFVGGVSSIVVDCNQRAFNLAVSRQINITAVDQRPVFFQTGAVVRAYDRFIGTVQNPTRWITIRGVIGCPESDALHSGLARFRSHDETGIVHIIVQIFGVHITVQRVAGTFTAVSGILSRISAVADNVCDKPITAFGVDRSDQIARTHNGITQIFGLFSAEELHFSHMDNGRFRIGFIADAREEQFVTTIEFSSVNIHLVAPGCTSQRHIQCAFA